MSGVLPHIKSVTLSCPTSFCIQSYTLGKLGFGEKESLSHLKQLVLQAVESLFVCVVF